MVREIIRAERAREATVFLNSHLLGEVEKTCDRVVFVREGEVVDQLALGGKTDVVVRIRAAALPPDTGERLGRFGARPEIVEDGLRLTVASEDEIPSTIAELAAMGARIYAVEQERPSLEQRFLDSVGGEGGL